MWRALQVCSRREWMRRPQGFFCVRRCFFVFSVFSNVGVLLIRYLVKNGAAHRNSGFLRVCRDRFGVRYHPSLGVLLAVCHVSRVHVPFVMRCFYFFQKETGRRSKYPGCNFQLKRRVRAPASVPSFVFLFVFSFFLFSHLFLE